MRLVRGRERGSRRCRLSIGGSWLRVVCGDDNGTANLCITDQWMPTKRCYVGIRQNYTRPAMEPLLTVPQFNHGGGI